MQIMARFVSTVEAVSSPVDSYTNTRGCGKNVGLQGKTAPNKTLYKKSKGKVVSVLN
jgi:hypothetical protein